MKPVNCQRFPFYVPIRQPSDDMVLTPRFLDPKHCTKCDFSTVDVNLFKRHTYEHMASKPCCLYCQNVPLGREEPLKSSLKCPHCGQSYARNLSLLKHIERVHSKNMNQGLKKAGANKDAQFFNAVPGVHRGQHSTQPAVLPSLDTPAFSLGSKDVQEARSVNKILPFFSNAVSDNGIHPNRALTVSLPEEISIPAGCLVELVEVKTVNGSKELKLRLVSRHEKEAEMRASRTLAKQNGIESKTAASKLQPPNAVRSTNMGKSIPNKKPTAPKTAVPQSLATKPVSTATSLILNQAGKEKPTLKRTSQEVIDLETWTKVFKTVCHPETKEFPSLQSPSIYNRAKLPNVPTETSAFNSIKQPVQNLAWRKPDEKPKTNPESTSPWTAKRTGTRLEVLLERPPSVVCLNDNNSGPKIKVTPKVVSTPARGTLQIHKPASSKVISVVTVKALPPKVEPQPKTVTPRSSIPSQINDQRTFTSTSSTHIPVGSFHPESKIPAWSPGVQVGVKQSSERDTPKPEGFPVISSVFSLSQEPENAQAAIQPLVMALRGIVMDAADTSAPNVDDKDQLRVNPTYGSVKVESKEEVAQEPVKVESKEEVAQEPPISALLHVKRDVKMEKSSSTQTDNGGPALDLKSEDAQNPLEAPAVTDANRQHDIFKYVTVPLTRVDDARTTGVPADVGHQPKPPHDVIHMRDPSSNLAVRLMPLKAGQPVMCPSLNQPVVVLNHPKPRRTVRHVLDTVPFAGTPAKAPKCQILKMRLGKVVGQKYEVTGCTVRFSQ
ncbi:uncharacterized protein znf518b [Stigmatopora argus]